MRRPIDTLANGLGHPEGPDILPDGRIVMVETYTSKIVAWSEERGLHDYADCGGGPNACMLGSDGAVYITQNGGTVGAWRAEVMGRPSIQKAWPDGRVEEVVAEIDGVPLTAPNDLTFGPDGRLYFTDPADYLPDDRRPGRIWVLGPDGTGELLEEIPSAYTNGIVAEPDGAIVWVDSYERGVYRKRPSQASEQIARLPEGHVPDGLKIAANGDLWVTAFMGGGIDILKPDGTIVDFLETGGVPLNCVFHDGSLIITDFGDISAVTDQAPMDGRLWRVDVGVEGMPLFRGSISGGDPTQNWAQGRMQGFIDGITEAVPDANFINTAATALVTTYDPAGTYDAYKAFIQGNPEVQVIENVDIGGEHAARAIADSGNTGKIFSLGWNVSIGQLDAIEAGTQIVALDQQWGDQAGFGALACAELLKNGKVLPNTNTLKPITTDNVVQAREDFMAISGG